MKMAVKSHLPARFFKIILPSTITRHKLRIPSKFVGRYGDELSNVVKLTDVVDGTWYVKLEKAEKTIWLNDGWKKFADDHSIRYGYFLIFEYMGNSGFNVHIFDLTATEVDYPTNKCNVGGDDNITMDENSDDDDSVQIIDSFVTTKNCTTRSRKLRHENPSFRTSLKQYNVFKRLPLYVPAAFAKCLPGRQKHLELHDSDGKKWLLDVSRGKRGDEMYIGRGWYTVVKEKRLKVGDTCVFELIDVNKCMLKVCRMK